MVTVVEAPTAPPLPAWESLRLELKDSIILRPFRQLKRLMLTLEPPGTLTAPAASQPVDAAGLAAAVEPEEDDVGG